MVKALVPPELKEAAASAARAHGMTANDYIAALIAADTAVRTKLGEASSLLLSADHTVY